MLHSSTWHSGSSNLPRKQRCHSPSIMRRFASAICSGVIFAASWTKTFLGLCSSFLSRQALLALPFERQQLLVNNAFEGRQGLPAVQENSVNEKSRRAGDSRLHARLQIFLDQGLEPAVLHASIELGHVQVQGNGVLAEILLAQPRPA